MVPDYISSHDEAELGNEMIKSLYSRLKLILNYFFKYINKNVPEIPINIPIQPLPKTIK